MPSFYVKGKGGLIRKVPLHNRELVQKLCDNTKNGEKVFIYNHNKEFSNSDRNLTFHGLRHAYAQNRYQHFINKGVDDYNARLKVSKELGHFRVEITEIYLNKKKHLYNV